MSTPRKARCISAGGELNGSFRTCKGRHSAAHWVHLSDAWFSWRPSGACIEHVERDLKSR